MGEARCGPWRGLISDAPAGEKPYTSPGALDDRLSGGGMSGFTPIVDGPRARRDIVSGAHRNRERRMHRGHDNSEPA